MTTEVMSSMNFYRLRSDLENAGVRRPNGTWFTRTDIEKIATFFEMFPDAESMNFTVRDAKLTIYRSGKIALVADPGEYDFFS